MKMREFLRVLRLPVGLVFVVSILDDLFRPPSARFELFDFVYGGTVTLAFLLVGWRTIRFNLGGISLTTVTAVVVGLVTLGLAFVSLAVSKEFFVPGFGKNITIAAYIFAAVVFMLFGVAVSWVGAFLTIIYKRFRIPGDRSGR
jgi:hypothetical protein